MLSKKYNVEYQLKLIDVEVEGIDDNVVLDSIMEHIMSNKINITPIGEDKYSSYINISGVVGLKLVKYQLNLKLNIE